VIFPMRPGPDGPDMHFQIWKGTGDEAGFRQNYIDVLNKQHSIRKRTVVYTINQ